MTQPSAELPPTPDPPGPSGWVLPDKGETAPTLHRLSIRRSLYAGFVGAIVYLVSGVLINTLLFPGSSSAGLLGLVVGTIVAGRVAPARSISDWLFLGLLTLALAFALVAVFIVIAVALGATSPL